MDQKKARVQRLKLMNMLQEGRKSPVKNAQQPASDWQKYEELRKI